jgi:hypothetical protein
MLVELGDRIDRTFLIYLMGVIHLDLRNLHLLSKTQPWRSVFAKIVTVQTSVVPALLEIRTSQRGIKVLSRNAAQFIIEGVGYFMGSSVNKRRDVKVSYSVAFFLH